MTRASVPLTVVSVAYALAAVRPETAGGAEQVLAAVDRALAAPTHAAAAPWFHRAYQTIVDDAPAVWLYEPRPTLAIARRLRVVDVRPDAWWTGMARWSVAPGERIARDRIVLDPGIGFGKAIAENLALMNALPLFHALGQPLLVGASRKRMIVALAGEAPAHRRLGGSLALAMKALDSGVQLLRVHDAAETVQAGKIWRGLRDAALTDFAQLPG